MSTVTTTFGRGLRAGGSWLLRLPPGLTAALIAALLLGCWGLVLAGGGTRTALPHVFYVPIVVAALPFGVRGGVAAAVVATVLCGPLTPIDTATGATQAAQNWLVRGGFFVTVGALSGTSVTAMRRAFERELAHQLWSELDEVGDGEAAQDGSGRHTPVRDVLEAGAFRPVFQPIYRLDSGRLVAVEALTRFCVDDDVDDDPRPDVWFRRAAADGLGVDLELATLRAALDASAGLPTGVALSFNASPELLCDQRLLALVDAHRDRPLIAEVTEHAVVDDYRLLAEAVTSLRSRGIRLAVDDAGAGFASLRHVVRLEPDYIKLDPSLTQDLGHDPVRRPLADCLIEFAARTGSAIVVEGIEKQADLATWRHLGAHAAQGYLLGRPDDLPVAERTAMIDPTGSPRHGRSRARAGNGRL